MGLGAMASVRSARPLKQHWRDLGSCSGPSFWWRHERQDGAAVRFLLRHFGGKFNPLWPPYGGFGSWVVWFLKFFFYSVGSQCCFRCGQMTPTRASAILTRFRWARLLAGYLLSLFEKKEAFASLKRGFSCDLKLQYIKNYKRYLKLYFTRWKVRQNAI